MSTGPQDALGEVASRTLFDEHDKPQVFELMEMVVEALARQLQAPRKAGGRVGLSQGGEEDETGRLQKCRDDLGGRG